jgi:hypothetical protein
MNAETEPPQIQIPRAIVPKGDAATVVVVEVGLDRDPLGRQRKSTVQRPTFTFTSGAGRP